MRPKVTSNIRFSKMISVPVYTHTKGDFDHFTFVRNAGPNFVDDGLIGWYEFDENALNYFVHEYTQNNHVWGYSDTIAYQDEYDRVMSWVKGCIV